MTGKGAGGGDIKSGDLVRAFIDLVILVLLMVGAGFGGYWYGIHERLAPVKAVAPGTPGALPPSAVTPAPPGSTPTPTSTQPATTTPTATTSASAQVTPEKKEKFWVSSSGAEWTGYQIVVSVNDTQVDGFFGPGKTLNVTDKVKHGDNSVTFQAKYMGESYNRHKGNAKAALTVELVKGPKVTDEYKPSDVIARFTRNATQTEEETQSFNFTDGD